MSGIDATKCELDMTALKRARVFVDEREAAAAGGEVHAALQTGDYTIAEVCGEIGEVLAGQKPGRICREGYRRAAATCGFSRNRNKPKRTVTSRCASRGTFSHAMGRFHGVGKGPIEVSRYPCR
jgi:hypothetical protein